MKNNRICKKCGGISGWDGYFQSWICTRCGDMVQKRITNGDKIRTMTDEELDSFLGNVQWDVANYCGGVAEKQEYPVPEGKGAWLEWLKEEVEK